jgi:hypothetical protein
MYYYVNQLGLGRTRDRRQRTNAPPSEPFRRSSRCAGTTPPVPTNRGCSGLHAKPLYASIGRVFAPYRTGRTAGSNAIKKRRKSTILVGRFAGPVGVPVRNQAHRPTEGVQGYPGSHWSTPPGEYGGRYAIGQCFSGIFRVFSSSTRFSAGQDDVKAPNNIGV